MWISINVVFGIFGLVSAQSSDYCAISSQHSLCQTPAPSSYCGRVYLRGLTETEKIEALDEHNRLRSMVSTGGTSQPPAADMMELQWDEELARVAQARADTCQFGHECADCRRVSRFKVGQNIFRARDNRVEVPEWRYVIRSFFSEINIFPGVGSIASFKYTPGTGHYTQMMWSRVTRVGCGLITYYNQDTAPLIARYYVCDYGPSGNKVGDKMYAPGAACSQCPRGTSCTSRYSGLCSGPDAIVDNSLDNSFNRDQFQRRSGLIDEQFRSSNGEQFRKTSPLISSENNSRNRPVIFQRAPQVLRRRRVGPISRPCDLLCSLGRFFGFQ